MAVGDLLINCVLRESPDVSVMLACCVKSSFCPGQSRLSGKSTVPCLYRVSRKGNLLFARTYQKDLEPDGMCLDVAPYCSPVCSCDRLIHSMLFLEDCPNNIGINM
jgi:hypothetical protein